MNTDFSKKHFIYPITSILFLILCLGLSFLFKNSVDTYSETTNFILDKLLNYDSQHYLKIADNGYVTENLYAFFPLYPIMIKFLTFIGINSKIGGIGLSILFFLLSYFLLIKLTNDTPNQNKILKYFCISPIVCLALSVYTEYLFIFLTLSVYYLYKKKKYLLSGILIGITCLCRNFGFILYVIFAINLLLKEKKITKNIFLLSVPSILLGSIYPFYLLATTGDLLKFASIQSTFWNREFAMPWIPIIKDMLALFNGKPHSLSIVLNLIALLGALFIIIKSFKKERFLSSFAFVGCIVPLFTCVTVETIACLSSEIRYIFQIFPIYILMGNLNLNKRVSFYFDVIYITISFMCCTLFFMNAYIY